MENNIYQVHIQKTKEIKIGIFFQTLLKQKHNRIKETVVKSSYAYLSVVLPQSVTIPILVIAASAILI